MLQFVIVTSPPPMKRPPPCRIMSVGSVSEVSPMGAMEESSRKVQVSKHLHTVDMVEERYMTQHTHK